MKYWVVFLFLMVVNIAKAQPASGFVTSFDGTSIYYEMTGSGKPVILIHGFTSAGDSWKQSALYNTLQKEGYKVITVDLRGNGKSGKPHTPEAYQNDAEAKDLMILMDSLAAKEYDVVGYSRGAIIASRLLILDKKVDKVVIGGMGADFTNPDWPRRIMFYEALMGKETKELEGMVKRINDSGLDQLALAYSQNGQPSTSKEEFSRVTKSVMVISGVDDHDNGSARELAAMIPKADYVTVPGGHGGTSRTEEFSAAVIAFLKK